MCPIYEKPVHRAQNWLRSLGVHPVAPALKRVGPAQEDGSINDRASAIPGRPSPKIIARSVVEQMKPGAVIIDLAAEGGGNCEVTEPGVEVIHNDVIVFGPLNVPSELPVHASEMYSKNLLNFLTPMIENGEFKPDWDDEVIADSTLTRDGQIKHAPTREQVEGSAS